MLTGDFPRRQSADPGWQLPFYRPYPFIRNQRLLRQQYGTDRSSIEGSVRYEAFLMKMLFTAVALGAGFKGGEIVPTLCVGAALGCAFGRLRGLLPLSVRPAAWRLFLPE